MITEYITSMPPLMFHLIIAICSLAVVIKGSDLVVYGISHYARRLGVSDYLIGFLVISIGTAIPELTASITGTLVNQGQIVFGTVLGANLFELPLLGLILLISKKIKTKQSIGMNAPIITFFMIILPLLLVTDGVLSKVDGAILIIAFLVYIARLWHDEGKLGKMKKNVKLKDMWKDTLIFGISLAALLLGARYLVFSSIFISNALNISPYIVGLIVIGVGASAPELTVQLRSVFKHRQNLAFGNVLGSLVANSAMVLGIAAIIKPIHIQPSTILVTSIFLTIGILYALKIMIKKEVTWKHGLTLILFYIAFLIAEWIF